MKRERVPDLLIEQLLLGELPEEQDRELRADPQVQARLAELQESDRRILRDYRPEVVAGLIRQRMERETRRDGAARRVPGRRFRLAPLAGFAALLIAAGVTLAVLAPPARGPADGPEETRLKGARTHLVIHRRNPAGAETLAAGEVARAGDELQLGYVAPAATGAAVYGTIVSIDGRGVVTLHFPAGSAKAGRLEGEGERTLDYAYRLDDAPEFERFFLVTADRPFPVEEVLRAARKLAGSPQAARRNALALPAGLEQGSLLLLKR